MARFRSCYVNVVCVFARFGCCAAVLVAIAAVIAACSGSSSQGVRLVLEPVAPPVVVPQKEGGS